MALQASKFVVEDLEVKPLDQAKVKAEPPEDQNHPIGSKCRFRHIDGRWYDGLVVALEGQNLAKISFLKPTSENMLICKFFLQNRCRFGANCRLSHGVNVPLHSLKNYVPTLWEQSLVGSCIWAVSDSETGIWKKAELESWNGEIKTAQVVFRDNGTSAKLGSEAISLSKYAQMSDDEDEQESLSSSENYDSSEHEEESPRGLGFTEIAAQQKGIQTETALFANWENHTRGIASKMMVNMGYCEGMGLGASGQGILDPISVKVHPPKQSLDHAIHSQEKMEDNEEKRRKKQSRGGKRKRDKKLAEAARTAEEEDEVQSDVFSFINTQLAMQGKKALNICSRLEKQQPSRDVEEPKKEGRRVLVAYDDEVKELRTQVGKLEEMANRNKKEKVVYEAAMRKLNETRRALSEVEAAHRAASKAVNNKEREKKWLKF